MLRVYEWDFVRFSSSLVLRKLTLTESAVDLAATRKKQYEVAIGDAIQGCVVDAGFSIGIGPLFFSITISG